METVRTTLRAEDIANYDDQIAREKSHFEADRYNPATLVEHITSALDRSHEAFDHKVQKALGHQPWEYIISRVNAKPHPRVLSIGSGPCGVEIDLAKRFTVPYSVTCMDINEGVLQLGAEKAARDGVSLKAVVQDANFLKLTELYDVVLAHAALHHFINLEHIFQEIHDHLAPDGVFIAHEHVPRNGMLMWPETNELVNRVFAALPPRYRRLKTHQGIHIQQEYPEVDCSQDGFECVRSQDIVPLLEKMFRVEAKVLGHSFARRFVDGALGENYDLTREQDRALIEVILAFDDILTKREFYRPENVFMVLSRKY